MCICCVDYFRHFVLLDRQAAVLLVAKRSQIIANKLYLDPPESRPVVTGSGIVTVDFDRVTSKIYWADASQKKIWSVFQNGTEKMEVSEKTLDIRVHLAHLNQETNTFF